MALRNGGLESFVIPAPDDRSFRGVELSRDGDIAFEAMVSLEHKLLLITGNKAADDLTPWMYICWKVGSSGKFDPAEAYKNLEFDSDTMPIENDKNLHEIIINGIDSQDSLSTLIYVSSDDQHEFKGSIGKSVGNMYRYNIDEVASEAGPNDRAENERLVALLGVREINAIKLMLNTFQNGLQRPEIAEIIYVLFSRPGPDQDVYAANIFVRLRYLDGGGANAAELAEIEGSPSLAVNVDPRSAVAIWYGSDELSDHPYKSHITGLSTYTPGRGPSYQEGTASYEFPALEGQPQKYEFNFQASVSEGHIIFNRFGRIVYRDEARSGARRPRLTPPFNELIQEILPNAILEVWKSQAGAAVLQHIMFAALSSEAKDFIHKYLKSGASGATKTFQEEHGHTFRRVLLDFLRIPLEGKACQHFHHMNSYGPRVGASYINALHLMRIKPDDGDGWRESILVHLRTPGMEEFEDDIYTAPPNHIRNAGNRGLELAGDVVPQLDQNSPEIEHNQNQVGPAGPPPESDDSMDGDSMDIGSDESSSGSDEDTGGQSNSLPPAIPSLITAADVENLVWMAAHAISEFNYCTLLTTATTLQPEERGVEIKALQALYNFQRMTRVKPPIIPLYRRLYGIRKQLQLWDPYLYRLRFPASHLTQKRFRDVEGFKFAGVIGALEIPWDDDRFIHYMITSMGHRDVKYQLAYRKFHGSHICVMGIGGDKLVNSTDLSNALFLTLAPDDLAAGAYTAPASGPGEKAAATPILISFWQLSGITTALLSEIRTTGYYEAFFVESDLLYIANPFLDLGANYGGVDYDFLYAAIRESYTDPQLTVEWTTKLWLMLLGTPEVLAVAKYSLRCKSVDLDNDYIRQISAIAISYDVENDKLIPRVLVVLSDNISSTHWADETTPHDRSEIAKLALTPWTREILVRGEATMLFQVVIGQSMSLPLVQNAPHALGWPPVAIVGEPTSMRSRFPEQYSKGEEGLGFGNKWYTRSYFRLRVALSHSGSTDILVSTTGDHVIVLNLQLSARPQLSHSDWVDARRSLFRAWQQVVSKQPAGAPIEMHYFTFEGFATTSPTANLIRRLRETFPRAPPVGSGQLGAKIVDLSAVGKSNRHLPTRLADRGTRRTVMFGLAGTSEALLVSSLVDFFANEIAALTGGSGLRIVAAQGFARKEHSRSANRISLALGPVHRSNRPGL
ncbi:hypothetical protein Dda_5870 [Drechslerella dactyloides]|uniref:Uncharacterized protein n=1 Tax=Drechslerella dactyloides TaxID=74499 RepID=A0AAD6IWP6_DREDA|nr:hypothetical protein Dda_5870 [Drechslerella dactyloides]